MNAISNELINKLVNVFEKENKKRKNKELLDIPFLVAPLHQAFDNGEYRGIENDLGKYADYQVFYSNADPDNYFMVCCIEIDLLEPNGDGYYNSPKYTYEIRFGYDQRCDWIAPTVSLHRVYNEGASSWDGEEEDYMNFRYKFEKSSLNKTAFKYKDELVEHLKSTISECQDKLCKLL